MSKKVTGLGGVFFRSQDPSKLRDWYTEQLGIPCEEWGFAFTWRERDEPEEIGYTVWSPFSSDSDYFAPSEKPFMLNFRVENLDGLLEELRAAGAELVGEPVSEANGKFAWVLDPEGNKLELWEPVPSKDDPYLPPSGDEEE